MADAVSLMRYKRVSAAIFLVAIPIFGDTTTYNSRDIFLNSVGPSVTDDYSSPGYGYDISDAEMSAVFGQTQYRSTSFPNINLVSAERADPTAYCAGCNGSFDLIFTSTTLGNANGVYGAGFDIVINEAFLGADASAIVTFGDGRRRDYALPTISYGPYPFWGITSDTEIKEIDVVGPDGLPSPSNDEPTRQITFAIDNLTIAAAQDASALPEPSLGVLSGLCFITLTTCKLYRLRSRQAAPR
jgi:hypothetical protein